MSLTGFAVRNYRFITVVGVAAVFLGAIGYLSMPRQEDPPLPAFGGIATVIYPGATPEEVEDRILEPLEKEIHALEEINVVEGSARDGVAIVSGEFREEVDRQRAYDLFVQRVTSAREDFPEGVVEVETREMKPSSVVVLQAAVHGRDVSSQTLRRWAEELERRWEVLPDAKEVALEGEQQQEVHVAVDPERLAAAGLTLGELGAALAAANGDLPGGIVHNGGRQLSLRPNARYEDLGDVEETVLRAVDGRPVRVADLATVTWADEDPRYRTRFAGEPAVLVTLTLKEGRNVFGLAQQARAELDALQRDLPEAVSVSLALDQSEDVSRRLRTFARSLLQGAGIIVIFVALLLGWRPAVVIISAMLLSVAIAFGLLEWRGIALQQMSIAGLVVVLGLLVDNAIVVVEGILQQRQQGLGSIKSAILGTDRVAAAVASSTATTIAAFAPMLLMEGSVGDFTRDIPTVVSLVLIVSLFVALFVTPLLSARIFRSERSLREPLASRWLHLQARVGAYRKTLDFLLRRPVVTIAALLLLALGTLSLTPFVGFNFFPRADDKPSFLVRVIAPQGSNLDAVDGLLGQVERHILEAGWARTVTANVGRGNPLIYYNHIREGERPNFGELLVTVPPQDSGDIPQYARDLRERYASHPDFVLETKLLVQGPPIGLPVSIRLRGRDLERLRSHADEVAAKLREIDGAINVTHGLKPGSARLDLRVDPVKIGKLGLDTGFVAREIRFAMAGLPATVLRRGDEDHRVVVRVAPEGNESLHDLDRVRIPVAGTAPVPLAQLLRPELSSTYAQIEHTDQQRSVVVGSDTDGRLAAEIVAELLPTVEALDFNGLERFEVIGEDEERDRAFLSMLRNVILAMGIIYGILVLQFRSFALPLVIFTSIPVALAGSVLGLLLGGWPFGFMAFIGLLALVGIVVNDAIVLVDQINQLRRGGARLEDAIRDGAATRLQPILLTTLTTIAGLLPLTLSGGSMWGPMGWVIIGGLVAATSVTLVMVPAMYVLLERRRERVAEEAPSAAMPRLKELVGAALIFGLSIFGVASPARAQAEPDTLRLGVDELVRRVDQANPDLAAARANISAAEAAVSEAQSAWWPTVSLGADVARTDDPAQTFGLSLSGLSDPMDLFAFDPTASQDVLRMNATVQWALWDFARGPRIDAAGHLHAASREDFQEVRESLRLLAISGLFSIERLVGELRVADSALASIERQLEDARTRERAGRGLAADVLGLSARDAELRSRRVAAAGALAVADEQLAELLALEAGQRVRRRADSQVPTPTMDGSEELMRAALSQRPLRGAAAARVEAAAASVRAAEGERWPRLFAQAQLDAVAADVDWDERTDSYTVGVGLSWQPFQGGAVNARKKRDAARKGAAQHLERAVELELRREAREAWVELVTARSSQEAAQLQRDSADEAFRVVRLRYEEGRVSLSRFLQAELARTEAESALVRANAGLQIARARVWRVAGVDLGGPSEALQVSESPEPASHPASPTAW